MNGTIARPAPTHYGKDVKPCVRCGIERVARSHNRGTGLCRDCLAVDPTFGQSTRRTGHA